MVIGMSCYCTGCLCTETSPPYAEAYWDILESREMFSIIVPTKQHFNMYSKILDNIGRRPRDPEFCSGPVKFRSDTYGQCASESYALTLIRMLDVNSCAL